MQAESAADLTPRGSRSIPVSPGSAGLQASSRAADGTARWSLTARAPARPYVRPHSRPRAFTLVELLVVMTVLALLVGILCPSLSKARALARTTLCATHLRQVGTAICLYADRHAERYPTAERAPGGPAEADWWQNGHFLDLLALPPNPLGRSVVTCPTDRTPQRVPAGSEQPCWASYAANASALGMRRGRSKRGRKRGQIRSPALAVAFCDALGSGEDPLVVGWQGCVSRNFGFRHTGRSTVLYFDGHVDWIRAEAVPLSGSKLWEEPFWGNLPCFDEP